MSFAVIKTGGKQYKVSAGDVLKIEKLAAMPVGEKVTFDQVLLVADGKAVKVGSPLVAGATVTATVTKEGKAKKITVIHYKAKVRYQKTKGHRQPFTEVKIDSIK